MLNPALRAFPKDLIVVKHANGRVWFQLPGDPPENSVDFTPAIAHRLMYTVRDFPGRVCSQIERCIYEADGHMKLELPRMVHEERAVELSPTMTRALLRTVRDHAGGFCKQLEHACRLARMDKSNFPNLSNRASPS